MTFVLVGAGPDRRGARGVFGANGEGHPARKFRRIDPSKNIIILLEGGGRVPSELCRVLSEES